MKWLREKYTYILIAITLIVCTSLQIVWIEQLFLSQKKNLKDEIEFFISKAAQENVYYSITSLEKPGNIKQLKQFFLSPQWLQLSLAFGNMEMKGMTTNTVIEANDDSTKVRMNFTLSDQDITAYKSNKKRKMIGTGSSPKQLKIIGNLSLVRIKKKVDSGLRKIGVRSKIYYTLYAVDNEQIIKEASLINSEMGFTSKKYFYDIQSNYRCQISLKSINFTIWYRMRYYLISSVIMVALICIAFYLIIKLLRKQSLYASAKSDFTSNMTHEFKTPIATVLVALESIVKYNLIQQPEVLQNYIDISQHELRRLDLMVEKVLNISNDDNYQPLKPELYDLQSGLEQVINIMQPRLININAKISFNSSKEPCFVFGDPVHLTNIFYNLIDNAIKYSINKLIIEITFKSDYENITLSFKDNGPGIDSIYFDNIFEKFYRIPVKGATHNIKGSGLGLHYVKQIIEKHKGTIRIKSEVGAGTNFIISLPKAK